MNYKPPAFLLVGLPPTDVEPDAQPPKRVRKSVAPGKVASKSLERKGTKASSRPVAAKFDKTSLQRLEQILARAREAGEEGSSWSHASAGITFGDKTKMDNHEQKDGRFQVALKGTLARTWRSSYSSASASSKKIDDRLATVVQDLSARPRVLRVGMLDLGAWMAKLQDLIVLLNKGQNMCSLFEVQVPVPGGLIKTERGFYEWAQTKIGPQADPREYGEVPRQMIADEFFKLGRTARQALGLDVLVGLTSAGIAGVDDTKVHYGHRVASAEGLVLLSIAGLRTLSEEAGRRYEAAVGMMLLRKLIAPGRADGHAQDCAMSDCVDLAHLRAALSKMDTCPECARLLEPAQFEQAASALKLLRAMRRPAKKSKPTESP
jgi:hypothetical protein